MTLRLHARRIAIGAKQTTALECGERAAIAVLADAVENNIESTRQNAREVFAVVINRYGAEFANQRCMPSTRSAPQFEASHFAENNQSLPNGACGSMHENTLSPPHSSRAM